MPDLFHFPPSHSHNVSKTTHAQSAARVSSKNSKRYFSVCCVTCYWLHQHCPFFFFFKYGHSFIFFGLSAKQPLSLTQKYWLGFILRSGLCPQSGDRTSLVGNSLLFHCQFPCFTQHVIINARRKTLRGQNVTSIHPSEPV